MTYKFKSDDGLLSSNDPETVMLWNSIGTGAEFEEYLWTSLLREMGVKLAHPDDGWVTEAGRGRVSENYDGGKHLRLAYAQFNDDPQVGDLIALGWPAQSDGHNYRLVRVIRIEHTKILTPSVDYYYVDTGVRLPVVEPEPDKPSLFHAFTEWLRK